MDEGPSRRRTLAVIARVFDYCFGLLYVVLAVRLVLELIGARTSTGFYQFVAHASEPFYAPFRSIVRTDTVEGLRVVWPLVIAIFAYMILHALIRGLLNLLATRT